MNNVKRFNEEFLNKGFHPVEKGETFYKIINKDNVDTWLSKELEPDKKTMVTRSKQEVGEINPTKTAVEITGVPPSAVIDTEGNWAVLELFPFKNQIRVRPVGIN